jgi:DNA-binding transcriptional regulator YdaS (Cro superfamily)
MSKSPPLIETVIERLGGPTKAAEALGIKNASVISNWKTRGRVPVDHVLEVERITGISRHELRPDLSRIFVESGPSEKEDAA